MPSEALSAAIIDQIAKLQLPAELGYSPKIDALETALAHHPQVNMPITHHFTPGMYAREIFMPAGTLCTSKIHRFEHMYVVMQGECSVWTEKEGVVHIKAPYVGITKPGMRRVLYIRSDSRWIAFYPTKETSIEAIEKEFIYPHVDHLGLTDGELGELRKVQHVDDALELDSPGVPKLTS